MKTWMKIILVILGLPKSLYVNFKSFPLKQAIYFPLLVSPLTSIISTKGKMRIDDGVKIKPGLITIGLSGFGLALSNKCVLQNNGEIVFKGRCKMGGVLGSLVQG